MLGRCKLRRCVFGFLVVTVCLGLLAGCASTGPLQVPNCADVRSIEAHISNAIYDPASNSYVGGVRITDVNQIAEIVRVLEGLNNRLSVPADTFPAPTHTIVFNDTTGKNLVVYVGLNWIGGRNNVAGSASTNRLRRVSSDQRQQFLQTVGIRDYQF